MKPKPLVFLQSNCATSIRILFLTLFLLAMPPAAPAGADTTVNSNITTDTTWNLAGSPYIVAQPFLVYGTDGADGITTLTIEPGVVVRFNLSRYFIVGSSGPGALVAQGMPANPVIFTSNQAAPVPGSWQGVWISSSADDATTRLEHCAFEYAGLSYGAVYIQGAAPTLQNCTFSNSGNYDIKYSGEIGGTVSGCTINNGINFLSTGAVDFSGNTINYNNAFPIIAKAENVHGLLNGNTFNNVDAASFFEVSTGTITQDATWPAIIPCNMKGALTVQGTDGADGVTTLTLEPGFQIRFQSGGILNVGAASGAPGALSAQGTAALPIVFTSNAATPAAGDWSSIRIFNTADDALTRLEHCLIEYAGYLTNAAVQIKDAAPTLTNCTFSNCAYYDLDYSGIVGGTVSGCTINNGIKLNATGSVDFTGNTVNYTNSHPIIAKANSVHSLVNGNTYNNLDAASYLEVYSDTITRDATWTDAIPLFISGNLTVQGTDGPDNVTTLTIEPGARLKFGMIALKIGAASGDPGALIAQGTSDNMILFTANQPIPAPGYWDNIHFYATAAESSLLEYCVVEYGGRIGRGAVYLDNTKVAVRNSTIRNNYVYGLYVSGTGSNGSEIQCNIIENNGNGLITVGSAFPIIEYNNFINNTSFGLRSNTTGLIAENNWWGDADGPNQSGDKTYVSVDFDPWSTEPNQCLSGGTNQPPYQPTAPTPADNAVRVSTTGNITTLSWTGGDPDPDNTVVYDIYTGTTADNLALYGQNVTEASHVITEPIRGVTYYWQVISRDNYGLESTGPVWRFTTAGDPADLIISNVTTNPPGNLQSGQSVAITTTLQNNGAGPVVTIFTVLFKVDNTVIGMPTVNQIMLAGQSMELSLPWSYAGGNPTIDIMADSQNTVVETDNQNNRFTALLYEVADMTAPVLTNTTPAADVFLQQVNQIAVSLADSQSAVDDAGVISSLVVSDSSQQGVPGTVSESNDTFVFMPALVPMADDTYTVTLVGADIHGNTQTYSFVFTADSQPPAKPVITGGTVASGTIQVRPSQNTSNQFIVELAGTRETDTAVLVNGVEWVGVGGAPWSIQIQLQPGDNALEVKLKDRAGNQSEAEWIDVNVTTANAVLFNYDASGRVKRIETKP